MQSGSNLIRAAINLVMLNKWKTVSYFLILDLKPVWCRRPHEVNLIIIYYVLLSGGCPTFFQPFWFKTYIRRRSWKWVIIAFLQLFYEGQGLSILQLFLEYSVTQSVINTIQTHLVISDQKLSYVFKILWLLFLTIFEI